MPRLKHVEWDTENKYLNNCNKKESKYIGVVSSCKDAYNNYYNLTYPRILTTIMAYPLLTTIPSN